MMKIYLLLIAICIAQCSFLQDYAEADTCDVNVICSMVPYVKSCEEYDECYRDGWYYNVKYHECKKITIKDGYYPTDNFYKTKEDCDCACLEPITISEYKNLDPTYECKKPPTFYSEGYSDSKYSGQLWTYDFKYKECVTFDYPVSDYQGSYNIFYNKQDCEDFCINYLYDYEHEGDDYNNYGGDDYMKDDYKNDYEMKEGEYNDEEKDYEVEYKKDDYKKDEYKKDDYKKDEYKKDDHKKDEYKKDDYKKEDDYKKDEYKKDDYKKEGEYNDEENYEDKENKNDYEDKEDEYDQEVDDNYYSGSSMDAKAWHRPIKPTMGAQSQKRASPKLMNGTAILVLQK